MYEGDKVILRSVELSDLDEIMKNWNNLKLREFLSTPMPFSRDEEEQWIRSTWQNRKEGKSYQFTVINKETKEFLGTAGLFDFDNVAHSAELGIAIHAEKNWGKGFGTDTMNVLMHIGFDFLNLNRITLRVFEFNERAINTYKKVGFTQVGVHRQEFFKNGQYYNVVHMDILQEEWKKMKNEK
ncbi:MAG: GNAT family N-acetyltransferase [Candidatus Thorarchaeota archaeon]